jgi:hypothetical protein
MLSGDDLLGGLRPDTPPTPLDPEEAAGGDLLREAQLTDVRFDPVALKLALVFDLREAFAYPEADVAVAVLTGVRDLAWLGSGSANEHQAWHVVDAKAAWDGYWCGVEFALLPNQRLRAQARSFELLTGRSEHFEAAPPDLGSAPAAEIRAGFPRAETQLVLGESFVLAESR